MASVCRNRCLGKQVTQTRGLRTITRIDRDMALLWHHVAGIKNATLADPKDPGTARNWRYQVSTRISWVGVRRLLTFPYCLPRPAWCYPKILVLTPPAGRAAMLLPVDELQPVC